MNFLNRSFVALVASALSAVAPAVSQAEPVAKVLPDYTVFVDPPTASSSSSCRRAGSSWARLMPKMSASCRPVW